MREIVFRVVGERPGELEAQAEALPLRIAAATLEELQHEAREALIQHLGPAHCAYRVRVRRCQRQPESGIRGCIGIRRLHRWTTAPRRRSQERADDPAPAPTLSTDL